MTADELTTNILNSEDLAQAIVKKFIDLDGKFVLLHLPHNKILLYNILICILHIDLYIFFRRRNNIYGRIIADHQLTLARTKSRFCYTCSNQIKQYREQLDIISWQKNQCNRQTHTHTHVYNYINHKNYIMP